MPSRKAEETRFALGTARHADCFLTMAAPLMCTPMSTTYCNYNKSEGCNLCMAYCTMQHAPCSTHHAPATAKPCDYFLVPYLFVHHAQFWPAAVLISLQKLIDTLQATATAHLQASKLPSVGSALDDCRQMSTRRREAAGKAQQLPCLALAICNLHNTSWQMSIF